MKIKLLILSLLTPWMAHALDFEVRGHGLHTAAGVTYHYTVTYNMP